MISILKIARWISDEKKITFREKCPFCHRTAAVVLSRNQFRELNQAACYHHFSGYQFNKERGIVEFRFSSEKNVST